MSGVLRRRGQDTQRYVGKKAMWGWGQEWERSGHKPRNSKERCQLPEAGREQKGFFTTALGGTRALTTPWDRSSGLHKCDKINSCCLKPGSWWCFIMRPQGTDTLAMKCSHQTTRGHCLPPNVDPVATILHQVYRETHIVFKLHFSIMVSKLKCIP